MEDRDATIEPEATALKQSTGATYPKGRTSDKDLWDKLEILFGPILSFVSALVVITIAYFVKDSVDNALRERQLEIASAEAMQPLIAKLRTLTVPLEDAQAAALSLAAFGPPAVPLLVNELHIGSAHGRIGAEYGLLLLGVTHEESTCQVLQDVLTRNARQFNWKAHLSAVRVLAQARCGGSAAAVLRNYGRERIPNTSEQTMKAYGTFVYPDPAPSPESIKLLKEELEIALELLKG